MSFGGKEIFVLRRLRTKITNLFESTLSHGYTCVTWHTWPPNHSDTHLSGTTAPTRWILLLSSGHFLHATHRSSQAGRKAYIAKYKAAFHFTHLQPHRSFFHPSWLPSSSPPTTVRKAEPPYLRVGFEPAATHRHVHGCCIAGHSQ